LRHTFVQRSSARRAQRWMNCTGRLRILRREPFLWHGGNSGGLQVESGSRTERARCRPVILASLMGGRQWTGLGKYTLCCYSLISESLKKSEKLRLCDLYTPWALSCISGWVDALRSYYSSPCSCARDILDFESLNDSLLTASTNLAPCPNAGYRYNFCRKKDLVYFFNIRTLQRLIFIFGFSPRRLLFGITVSNIPLPNLT